MTVLVALTKILIFCTNAPDNFLGRELGMKREVSGGLDFQIHFHPWLPIRKESALADLSENMN